MAASIDLHIHSNKSSDGELSPTRIVRLAEEHGMKAVAIADHDTVAAYPEAVLAGRERGVEVIPSVELTTRLDKREFHLLLPFVDWESPVVKDLVARVADGRLKEARDRVIRLKELGLEIDWEDVMEEAGDFPPLGVTIALAVLKRAKRSNNPMYLEYYRREEQKLRPYLFYKHYFSDGQPACVPRRTMAIEAVLDETRKTGGVPVLAHPGAAFMKVGRQDLAFLRNRGLQGLEVFTTYHDKDQTAYYSSLAREFGLVPTTGSDFHGKVKPHVAFGCMEEGGYWMVEELKKRRPKWISG
jgi:predicted metal-dependent phosphoesterase TrpH